MDVSSTMEWLPPVFAGLMVLAAFVYAILDGYDIGVGILVPRAADKERDVMISSIGPYWDANETWLVLAVGLLLIAFPKAQGVVLGELYLPVFVMLAGLIARGVSFDFRAKAPESQRGKWEKVFTGGSLLMAVSQGYMLGSLALGFADDVFSLLFSLSAGVVTAFGYALMGASWLVMKTDGELQKKAVGWALLSLYGAASGLIVLSIVLPFLGGGEVGVYPEFLSVLLLPALTLLLAGFMLCRLRTLPRPDGSRSWEPFAFSTVLFLSGFVGLSVYFYPYIVPGRIEIAQASAAPESLLFILFGALIMLPFLIGYTIYAYKVFHGKTTEIIY